MHTISIDYFHNPTDIYSIIRNMEYAVMLDSANGDRFDIISAQPIAIATTSSQLDSLQKYLQDHTQLPDQNLPFVGGIIGCFNYDSSDMLFGLYDWAIITDHLHKKTSIVVQPSSSISPEMIAQQLQQTPLPILKPLIASQIHNIHTQKQYSNKIERLQQYILAGDCYQANIAEKITATCHGDSLHLYQRLRKLCPTNYSAYIQWQDKHLLCHSPERFISVTGNQVTTTPIKGTAAVYPDEKLDILVRQRLQQDKKELAENLMIVDLLRNDISQYCQPGSVQVEKLCHLETFANVHHLASHLIGKMKDDISALDLIRGCLPGGSITGAPKIRSMQIIEELEGFNRDLYCGSVAYFSLCGKADSNIIIRSCIRQQDTLNIYGGGGITIDSQWQQEYKECYDKIDFILQELKRSDEFF